MSRVALQTWGSEGDVRPFLALAAALARRGHEVRLAITDPSTRSYATPDGVRVHRLAPERMPSADEIEHLGHRIRRGRNPLRSARLVVERLFRPALPTLLDAARELSAWADVGVRHYFLHPAQAAAEEAAIVDIPVHPAPDNLPTRAWPPAGMPCAGGALNGFGWWLGGWLANRLLLGDANATRARLGLAPIEDIVRESWTAPGATLVAVSPALCPAPADWPASVRVTGWLRDAATADTTLPAGLHEFLEAGAPPVLLSFGSLFPGSGEERDRLLELLARAAHRARCRMIVQAPGAVGSMSEAVRVCGWAPHAALLRRCVAMVHHGGAGTTHAAAAAGVPSVVVPHVFDQFFWADRMARLGAAATPLPRARLTHGRLARRLRAVCRDTSMRQRAGRLALSLESEDGAANAVAAIEALAGNGSAGA